MPVLNRRGQAAMGIGDGPGSIDRRVIASPGGGICWLDDDRVILQTKVGGLYVVIVARELDRVEIIDPPRGANLLAAGGGRWLAWLAGTGLYGSLGVKPPAGLIAAGLDGTLAYCPSYQTGFGLVLAAPDGSEVSIPDALVMDRNCQVLGPAEALWFDFDGGLRVIGRPPVRPALKPGRTRLVTLPSSPGIVEDWLVYWAEGTGLVAQLDGERDGYVLESRPIAFNHDAVAVDGELVVAWSTTQGEGPDDLRKVTVDRSLPRVRLGPLFTDKQPGPIHHETPTMQAKALPSDVHAIVVALHARNLVLANGSDDQRRELQKKICETVRARKGASWGWKSNHGVNVANAKDAIAQLPDGDSVKLNERQPLYMWDLFNGSTRAPNKMPVLSETEHVEQYFVPVDPIDHLASVPPKELPPPADRPPVSGDGSAPTFDQAKAALVELNRFYKEEDGLARGKDQFYDLGILDWFALVMSGTSVEHVKASIRTFDEYKRRHPQG